MFRYRRNLRLELFLLALCLLCAVLLLWRIFMLQPKTLNIYTWDDTFRQVLADYYPAYDPETETIGNVHVHWYIFPDAGGVYQAELDKALKQQQKASARERVDIFLAEADYVRKYAGKPDYALSLQELGLTDEDMAEQYSYTRAAATDINNIQRGISWQATPGVMLYRRDMARRIFGTDDPDDIQQLVGSWPLFEAAADKVAADGGTMLAGFFDSYRVFANERRQSWLKRDEIYLDPALRQWVEQTQRFTDEGKLLPCDLWDAGWKDAVRGRTFCYFGPAWFIDDSFILTSLETPLAKGGKLEKGNGTFGQWGACEGPQPFFWGGTWLCAARGTDNAELIADIMRTICCSKDTALKMSSQGKLTYVNHRSAMLERAADPQAGMPFLDGQNPYTIMHGVAEKINNPVLQMTPYDQGLHESFHLACEPYFRHQASWNLTWQRFLATVWEYHPEMQNASLLR